MTEMQEAYAKADIERLQKRVYDLLAETERLRAMLNPRTLNDAELADFYEAISSEILRRDTKI